MVLVLPVYNVHPYFSPQKFGQKSAHYTQKNTVINLDKCIYSYNHHPTEDKGHYRTP